MQLFSGPLSLFTAKVRIALDEKGLDYERIEVPFASTLGAAPPEHLSNLGAWLQRIDARPAVEKEIKGLARAVARVGT